MNKYLDQLLQTEMTRREFLRTIGLMILSVIGVGNLLRYLGTNNFVPAAPKSGYGSSSFGGKGRKNLRKA